MRNCRSALIAEMERARVALLETLQLAELA